MALAELITTRYPKDTIDIIVFGNDAWPIKLKDLPYPASRTLPYEYGRGLTIGNGYFTEKKEYEQANFYDYRW